MDPTTMMNAHLMGHHPQYVFYQTADIKRQPTQFQPHQMYPNVPVLPSTPVFSRPNSAGAQPQAPTLYSNIGAVMTPMASPQPIALKPSIMLETEIRDHDIYYPQTPPLSSSGSSVGSPGSVDHLQTPVNPMFSGLDGVKSELEAFRNFDPDFPAASPPLTPSKLNLAPRTAIELWASLR
jgi:C2H2 transcription facotor